MGDAVKMNLTTPKVAVDRGCVFWPRCTTCVFARCVAELAPPERGELTAALRVVRSYLAAPDGTIPV